MHIDLSVILKKRFFNLLLEEILCITSQEAFAMNFLQNKNPSFTIKREESKKI